MNRLLQWFRGLGDVYTLSDWRNETDKIYREHYRQSLEIERALERLLFTR